MKIVKVTYTTQEAYAAQNKANIAAVMSDLQAMKAQGIIQCMPGADGKTFIHTAFFQSEEDQQLLFGLASFKHFQQQLKESGPETHPRQELLSLVGSGNDIFG